MLTKIVFTTWLLYKAKATVRVPGGPQNSAVGAMVKVE